MLEFVFHICRVASIALRPGLVAVLLLVSTEAVFAQPTIERVNQAFDIADQAASHGLTELSMRAVERALRFGPPTVSTFVPRPTLQHFGARVDTSRPVPLTPQEAIDLRIRKTIFRLPEVWSRKASPVEVYETLRKIVMPTDRPSEVFLYGLAMKVDPLQPSRLPAVKNVATLLIEAARKANAVADLQAAIEERDISHSTSGNLLGLLVNLELQNAERVEYYSESISLQLVGGASRQVAELTASVGISCLRNGNYPTVAASLLQSAGQTINRIDAVERHDNSPGPAILLASARCWFSAGKTQRGVRMLQQYLGDVSKSKSGNILNRNVDVVGSELFSRGLVREAHQILGDDLAEVFERRYQMTTLNESPQPQLPLAVAGGAGTAKVVPASAIRSLDDVADQIWVCQLNLATESSAVLFTIPDFQHADSPAVSPDGSAVAFDASFPNEAVTSDSRIYVAQIDGSKMSCLGKGCSPSWSPAGKRIAYSAYLPTRGVWIMRSNGEDARLIDRFGWSGQWSPDGRMLAYTRLSKKIWDVVVYDIVENEFFSAFGKDRCPFTQLYPDFTWSPDSRSVLLKTSRSHDPGNVKFELTTLPVLSSGLKTFVQVNQGLGDDVAWHPDGTVAMVVKRSKGEPEQLFSFDSENSETRAETPVPFAGQFEDRRNVGVSWMPDGKSLIYISKPVRK